MRSIEQINQELNKNKEHIKTLKEKRTKRLKANRKKLKNKLGAHIAHDNKNITLNNYRNFTSITKNDLENYYKTINHLKNISNQMKYINNEDKNNKGYWQMQNFQSVCMWLAAKFRTKDNKSEKESNRKNSSNYTNPDKKQNHDKNKNYKQSSINLFNKYKN